MLSYKDTKNRLTFASAEVADGIDYWGVPDYPNFDPQPDDTFMTAVSTDRLDSIAYRVYGSPVYWWVIATANSLDMGNGDLYPGLRLRLPSLTYVKSLYKKAEAFQ